LTKERIVIVSNRLPITINKRKGCLNIQESPGGLATGLRSLQLDKEVIFIGWPGYSPDNKKEKEYIEDCLKEQHQCYPVYLTRYELDKFYYGFSNQTLWPLFHYFSSYCSFEERDWKIYQKVNQKFFQKVIEISGSNDSFWVHDYHLMLLPQMIREHFPDSGIGFFLHIPFPSSEIFRILPWRTDILKGLLGSDLIGFHTYEYARHFLSSVLRLLGYENEFGSIAVDDRIIQVEDFPMGIDSKQIAEAIQLPQTQKEIKKLRHKLNAQNKKIILSIDRLDYSKGIPQRLEAFEIFLSKNLKWHNKIIYIMICVPSRTKVKDYALLKEKVDGLVGKINGRFGAPGWTPIEYMYRSLPFKNLLPLYSMADVALVTPVRDGMNLVAKEYVAAKTDNQGVLILSGTAGAAAELGEAIIINAYSKTDIIEALTQALKMPKNRKTKRMKTMRKRILEYDIHYWIQSFITAIEKAKDSQGEHKYIKLTKKSRETLFSDYKKSQKRLLLFDYDGTLISFTKNPEDAKPDNNLKIILSALAEKPENSLVIISGRGQRTMERWLGDIPCSLVAEHGALYRIESENAWESQKLLSAEWKEQVYPILKTYEARVPGSLVEEKIFGLAWHYRKANLELGNIRSKELFDNLNEYLSNTDLQIMHGKKVIEVRIGGVNKGTAADHFLNMEKWDFVLALGDDWTDEDLFKALPPSAYTIKIGYGATQARFYLKSPQSCRALLQELAKS